MLSKRVRELQGAFTNRATMADAAAQLLEAVQESELAAEDVAVFVRFVRAHMTYFEAAPHLAQMVVIFVQRGLLQGTPLLELLTDALAGYYQLAPDHRLVIMKMISTCLHAAGPGHSLPAWDDFVVALLDATRGEKDPACIMSFLGCVSGACIDAEYAEEMFDAVCRYFPITFTATPARQHVSAAELKAALATTMSHPLFGPFLTALLAERMPKYPPALQREALEILQRSIRGRAFASVELKNLLVSTVVSPETEKDAKELACACISAVDDPEWHGLLESDCLSMLGEPSLAPFVPLLLSVITVRSAGSFLEPPHSSAAQWLSAAVALERADALVSIPDAFKRSLPPMSTPDIALARTSIRVAVAVLRHDPDYDFVEQLLAVRGEELEQDLRDAYRKLGAVRDYSSTVISNLDNRLAWSLIEANRHCCAGMVAFVQGAEGSDELLLALGCELGLIDPSNACYTRWYLVKASQAAYFTPRVEQLIRRSDGIDTGHLLRACAHGPIVDILALCARASELSELSELSDPSGLPLGPLGRASAVNKLRLSCGTVDALTVKALMIRKDPSAVSAFLSLSDVPAFLASDSPEPFAPELHHVVEEGYLTWFLSRLPHCEHRTRLMAMVPDSVLHVYASEYRHTEYLPLLKRLIQQGGSLSVSLGSITRQVHGNVRTRYALIECLAAIPPNRDQLEEVKSVLLLLMQDQKLVVRDAARRCYALWLESMLASIESPFDE